MTDTVLQRDLLDTPGDARERPHGNCYWVVPGCLLAGEYPSATIEAVTSARINKLLDAGVRQFIDLTTEGEGPPPYAPLLRSRAAERELRVDHRRFAIADRGVPPAALMRATLDAIYGAIGAGDTLYLHCWGGIGRTGTVVGCLLREQGFDAVAALAVLDRKWQAMEKRAWHPRSPETAGQIAFVERWDGRMGRDYVFPASPGQTG